MGQNIRASQEFIPQLSAYSSEKKKKEEEEEEEMTSSFFNTTPLSKSEIDKWSSRTACQGAFPPFVTS